MNPPRCPMCPGTGTFMGTVGYLRWFMCRQLRLGVLPRTPAAQAAARPPHRQHHQHHESERGLIDDQLCQLRGHWPGVLQEGACGTTRDPFWAFARELMQNSLDCGSTDDPRPRRRGQGSRHHHRGRPQRRRAR